MNVKIILIEILVVRGTSDIHNINIPLSRLYKKQILREGVKRFSASKMSSKMQRFFIFNCQYNLINTLTKTGQFNFEYSVRTSLERDFLF